VAIAELSKAGMSMAAGCSGPDSKRITVQVGFSDSLPATTGPEDLQYIMRVIGLVVFSDIFFCSDPCTNVKGIGDEQFLKC